MAKRFGRNQRRKLRAENAALQAKNGELSASLDFTMRKYKDLRFRYDDAENTYFQMYAQKHFEIGNAIQEIKESLAKKLGDDLYPYALQLL